MAWTGARTGVRSQSSRKGDSEATPPPPQCGMPSFHWTRALQGPLEPSAPLGSILACGSLLPPGFGVKGGFQPPLAPSEGAEPCGRTSCRPRHPGQAGVLTGRGLDSLAGLEPLCWAEEGLTHRGRRPSVPVLPPLMGTHVGGSIPRREESPRALAARGADLEAGVPSNLCPAPRSPPGGAQGWGPSPCLCPGLLTAMCPSLKAENSPSPSPRRPGTLTTRGQEARDHRCSAGPGPRSPSPTRPGRPAAKLNLDVCSQSEGPGGAPGSERCQPGLLEGGSGRQAWAILPPGGQPGAVGAGAAGGAGGREEQLRPHRHPLPPRTPRAWLVSSSQQGPGRGPAPTCGHHQPGSQRLLCRRGVWGSELLKLGFRVALIIRHLSHGWRGGDGGGPWHGGLLLCAPCWVSVTQAARARPQGPSVDLTTWLRAAEGLPQCPDWGSVPLPGMEQRGFRELETRAQRMGPHLGSTCLSPAKLWL